MDEYLLFSFQDNNETALHLAIQQEDGSSLPIVDFIIQNSNRSTSLATKWEFTIRREIMAI